MNQKVYFRYAIIIAFVLINLVNINAQNFGNALNFDGIDDYVGVPGGGALNNLQTGTIEMWVKWSGIQDSAVGGVFGPVIARQNDFVFSNQIIGLSGKDPATATIVWCPYSMTVSLTGTTPVGDNKWIHVAITYENGSHNLYINGVLDASTSTTGTISNNASILFTIGAWIDGGYGYSNSTIDEVRIWDIVRSQTDVYNDMYSNITSSHSKWTNLLAYYKFDTGTACGTNTGLTTLTDSKGSNDGTLTNMDLNGTCISNWVQSSISPNLGNALDFDGTDDYVALSGTFPNPASSNFTLEAWVYPTSSAGVRSIYRKTGYYNIYRL